MPANAWLLDMTQHSAAWWMSAIQQTIKDTSSKTDDPNHDKGDPRSWVAEVLRLVLMSLPQDETYDENLRVAAVLALILSLWYARTHYAKTQDPTRPVVLRQKAYGRWLNWTTALATVPLNERDDPAYFPGQRWDHPFAPQAEDGAFV